MNIAPAGAGRHRPMRLTMVTAIVTGVVSIWSSIARLVSIWCSVRRTIIIEITSTAIGAESGIAVVFITAHGTKRGAEVCLVAFVSVQKGGGESVVDHQCMAGGGGANPSPKYRVAVWTSIATAAAARGCVRVSGPKIRQLEWNWLRR